MPYRRVNDLMASPGICVRRSTGLGQVAELLAKHAITAVPVVDEDECPVGVVSDADLRQHEAHLPGPQARDREISTAGELMSSPAVTPPVPSGRWWRPRGPWSAAGSSGCPS
jgi:CBS-domain-containing membrane protein